MERAGGLGMRAVIGIVMALVAVLTYMGSRQKNPVTGEVQNVRLSAQQEIALGLQSAPQMAQQFGGLANNPNGQKLVERVGRRIVERSDANRSPYRFEFHLLDDDRTVNAFALPGGQIFVTEALARALRTEAELAGVLGHEIGHVVGRHSAEHLAKQELTQGLVGAVAVGADYSAAQISQVVGSLVNMKHGRNDELESDRLGVQYVAQAGYDPRAMIGVMEVLQKASRGSGNRPEFFSTHPNPENRVGRIKEAIQDLFPQGVPANLQTR